MNLTPKTDLTRWNRAGLSEFRYIDGNALTYLETLRQKLAEQYAKGGEPTWKELVKRFPELPGEKPSQTSKRLSNQYYDERRDYAWEILRTFARSVHILGEYINAYANEAYLPTAIEWDNVRKLAAMLGYRPAPPASAATYLALLFKEGESGLVEKGFAVKNKPGKGESTVIFETQDKLEGSAALNRLYLQDWNRNSSTFVTTPDNHIHFHLENIAEEINVGDVGVLATATDGVPVKVIAITQDTDSSTLELEKLQTKNITDFKLSDAALYLKPKFIASPLPNGPHSAELRQATGFTEAEIVFGKDSTNHWHPRRVLKNELGHLKFEVTRDVPTNGEALFRARVLRRQNHPGIELKEKKDFYLLPDDFSSEQAFFIDNALKQLTVTIQTRKIGSNGKWVDMPTPSSTLTTTTEQPLIRFILAEESWGDIYFPDKTATEVIAQAGQSALRFAGKDSTLESGHWALVNQGEAITAHLVNSLEKDAEWFAVGLTGMGSGGITLLRSAFKLALKPRNHNVNTDPAWSDASSNAVTILEMENPAAADELKLGQKLICASDTQAFAVELKDRKIHAGVAQLHVSPPFHLDARAGGFTRNNTVLYGNVVHATHGETQPEKIVGHGDASQTQQCFALPADTVSWVADATFTTGVRADLVVRVGDRVWQQVEDLSRSEPEAHHYEVKVNADGVLSICCGDGRHGRRLPTGIDNVRVQYRTGYGEQGNLAAHALVKIVRKHNLVEDFAAPLEASGGAAKESAQSMRENAPATVLALGRAVSLQDFTYLAAHHSMVWQAQAFEKMPDRPARPQIEVVVVAAGGATFLQGSDTAELIRRFLSEHSAPGTPIGVVSYQPLFMQLQLSVMVDTSAYGKQQVAAALTAHLQAHLDIRRRKLGQALFRSEIIALLEQVDGVENGHCEILDAPYAGLAAADRPRLHLGEDGRIRKISIKPRQLIYLDTEQYPLVITLQDYAA